MSRGAGGVSFVGLGPGDPSLRTVAAASRIDEADERVEGDQASIDAMIAAARAGKRVVRLAPGDPFEWPRVVHEMISVAEAGVAIDVLPGVAAEAAAGAFAAVVGRALHVLPADVARVVSQEGIDTPVTVIAAPGTAGQRVFVTVASRAGAIARDTGDDPVIVAFGAPDEALGWFERRPLFGKRVLVTRAVAQAASAAAVLRVHGALPVVVPTIVIHPPSDPAPLALAIERLAEGDYAWVAFTSANGVDKTWAALEARGRDARVFGRSRVAAIGPATARALAVRGLRADLVAEEYRGESLAEDMLGALAKEPPGAAVLVPRAARAREVFPEALRAAGYRVDVVPAYETKAPPHETIESLARELDLGRIDAVTFTSSSTVDNLCELLGPAAPDLLRVTRVASIGPVTTQTARARGLRVDVTARKYTVAGLVEALAESYEV